MDKQSDGTPWISQVEMDELAKQSVQIMADFRAIEKAFDKFRRSYRALEALSAHTIDLYRHRWQIEHDAAVDYRTLYKMEEARRVKEMNTGTAANNNAQDE